MTVTKGGDHQSSRGARERARGAAPARALVPPTSNRARSKTAIYPTRVQANKTLREPELCELQTNSRGNERAIAAADQPARGLGAVPGASEKKKIICSLFERASGRCRLHCTAEEKRLNSNPRHPPSLPHNSSPQHPPSLPHQCSADHLNSSPRHPASLPRPAIPALAAMWK